MSEIMLKTGLAGYQALVADLEYRLESTQAEILRLRALLDSIIARDDRNGSLPEWYRHEIDANYARSTPPRTEGDAP